MAYGISHYIIMLCLRDSLVSAAVVLHIFIESEHPHMLSVHLLFHFVISVMFICPALCLISTSLSNHWCFQPEATSLVSIPRK